MKPPVGAPETFDRASLAGYFPFRPRTPLSCEFTWSIPFPPLVTPLLLFRTATTSTRVSICIP
jgi:hypothetical protein